MSSESSLFTQLVKAHVRAIRADHVTNDRRCYLRALKRIRKLSGGIAGLGRTPDEGKAAHFAAWKIVRAAVDATSIDITP